MDHCDYAFFGRCATVLNRERILRDRTNPFDYLSDDAFRERFRFRKHVFLEILNSIDDVDESLVFREKECSLPLMRQLMVCLQYLATNKFQLSIADEFLVSQPTVSRIVLRMTHRLSRLYCDLHQVPVEFRWCKSRLFAYR